MTNIAETFVELRGHIKELFILRLSVASASLAVSVLSAVYVVVTKYMSIPQNDAGVISGWGFCWAPWCSLGFLYTWHRVFVSSIKGETVTYIHKIRIGLINAGGNEKAYKLLDELESS